MTTFSKRLLVFVSLSVSSLLTVVNAQSIKGKVLDATTGEPLVGAVVKLENTKFRTIVKLDGTYSFAKLPLGNYTIKVNYEGFANGELQTITLSDNSTKTISFDLKPTANELSSVTVSTSTEKNGEVGARRLEKISDPIINVLSEKTLQLLPDITVANALQRVSGVSIERSGSGEGRYPIIRGMEKRYINTLVNGIKIPSPDNKNRFIPLDLFPSELLERLEVSKSLTPSMEGDAIGGTINLVMKDAPEKRLLNVNASVGISDYFSNTPFIHFDHTIINKKSPNEINGAKYVAQETDFSAKALNSTTIKHPINNTFGLTFGNRFGNKKQFGLLVSGSFQNIYKGVNSFFLTPGQPLSSTNSAPSFTGISNRLYSIQTQRIGGTAKVDWKLNSNNKFVLGSTLVRLDDYTYRTMDQYAPVNRTNIDHFLRSTWQYQSIFNVNLQGQHKIGKSGFDMDWSLVYSKALNHRPDQMELNHYSYTITKADSLKSIDHYWIHNSDEDYNAYLNLTKSSKILNKDVQFKVGGMVRSKHRDNLYHHYGLTNAIINEPYVSVDASKFIFKGAGASLPDLTNGNDYTFDENIDAGYLQAKLNISPKFELLGGVRVEYTHQKYQTNLDSTSTDPKFGSIWYTDILPSFQVKYKIDNQKTIRLAYYKALARPSFIELIPASSGIYDNFEEKGNPDSLNHSLADNIDIRYEYFPGKAEQLLLGVFYKNINDPIEYATETVKATASQYRPKNFGTAVNYGFEFMGTKYVGNFGVTASYTYTHSSVTTQKRYDYQKAGKSYTDFPKQNRPLQGQSEHIGNISLLYKNPKNGLDVQLAYVYTGERLAIVNPYINLDYWQNATSQLDFSIEKKITKGFTVYAKINNLLNASYTLFQKKSYNEYLKLNPNSPITNQSEPDKKLIVQDDYYKATYLIGFRYKL